MDLMAYGALAQTGGMKLIEIDPAVQVRRTWKERLLSWPWRPWVKLKWILNPSYPKRGTYFMINKDTIVCGREDAAILKQEFRNVSR